MATFLLAVIYLVFLSLGLPDSLLGSSWPSISAELDIGRGMQGMITIIISAGTIVSSLSTRFLNKHLHRYGTVALSICLTVTGLVGYSFSGELYQLCLCAIPLGLGAGAIDATLSDYVANHYKAIHMQLLNAFWGIGALTSPFIMSAFLTNYGGWRKGALVLACIQGTIFLLTLSIIPVWHKIEISRGEGAAEEAADSVGLWETFKQRGLIFSMIGIFGYIALEQTSFNWYASLSVFEYGVSEDLASIYSSFFFIGITAGRIGSGFLSLKVDDNNLIRIGEGIILSACIIVFFSDVPALLPLGIALTGFGCGPIYPSILHRTPFRFGREYSSSAMSLEMVAGYIASLSMSALFGLIAQNTTFKILPAYNLIILALMALANEAVLWAKPKQPSNQN